MYEYELEAELEGEFENEFEWESEFEGELEAEYEGGRTPYSSRLWSMARRHPVAMGLGALATAAAPLLTHAAQTPTWGRVSPVLWDTGVDMARTGIRHAGDIGGAIGGEPGTRGYRAGQRIGSAIGDYIGESLPSERRPPDSEFEGEWEFEEEMNPLRRVYPAALMEHLGHAAAVTESEDEAEAFIGALIPLAARLIPRIAPAVMRVAPQLIRGAANVTRMLRNNPATRQLVRVVPNIVGRTAASLAQQASQGRPVTPARAVQTLARQTSRVMSNPQRCAQALLRSQALDRRHHRAAGAAASAVTPRRRRTL